jgi:hypothetical protein
MSDAPEFAIFQNSRTKLSAIWIKGQGKWKDAPSSDYEHLRLLATLIRTDPNPVEIVKAIVNANKPNNDKPTNWDVEPGFFIPPEELDGLE